MRRLWAAITLAALTAAPLWAASGRQPAPPGSFKSAPGEYTRFSAAELTRGFLALAFGSDLRIGARPKGVRRFDREIHAYVIAGGSVDRTAAIERILAEYGRKIPNLRLVAAGAEASADLVVRLIDEKDFASALEADFGRATAQAFVTKTDAQCMTSVKSQADGEIVRAVSFIIVDKGEKIFLDCAYHELLHAFGLSSHDQTNRWTTLNQRRMVGYLTVYDRALLTLLYDPRLRPGMTRQQAQTILPRLINDLRLAPGRDSGG